jgi:hypothetical protein
VAMFIAVVRHWHWGKASPSRRPCRFEYSPRYPLPGQRVRVGRVRACVPDRHRDVLRQRATRELYKYLFQAGGSFPLSLSVKSIPVRSSH